jgi:hypothetical protein
MKSLFAAACRTAILLVALTSLGCAGRTAAVRVGAPIDRAKPTSIAALNAHPNDFVGQTVLLKGVVSRVCKGRGCWVEVQAADGSAIIARSLDHAILLPTDCEGRRIVLQGMMSADAPEACGGGEAHHDEEGDVPAHECPQPTYLVATTGIELY